MLAGKEAQVWDLDVDAIAARKVPCPSKPAFVIDSTFEGKDLNDKLSDPNNPNKVYKGLDISRDGLTLGLGAEGVNAVVMVTLPLPFATLSQKLW